MKATLDLVRRYRQLFVNRLAYTRQSDRPDPETGRHYYFRPKVRDTGRGVSLTNGTIMAHLEGRVTIGLYSISPRTQRCKWLAFDADYENALQDLDRLQCSLRSEGIDSAFEASRRGGHLWMFAEKPLLASELQIFAYNVVLGLGLGIKAARPRNGEQRNHRGHVQGIEIFPRQNGITAGQFGSALRGPLGVHRGANQRFWFRGVADNLRSQIAYLEGLRKLNEATLQQLIAGKSMPAEYAARPVERIFGGAGHVFRILEHVRSVRRMGTEYVTQCPSCHREGRDRHRDNLHISAADELKYCCRAGCSADMIRAALGCPRRRSA